MNNVENELFKKIKNWYDAGHGYHTLTFPNSTKIDGMWDMSQHLQDYHIPEDLKGKTVLEIGPANGYFSFEFAKRGAEVTAIDYHKKWWLEEINQLMNTDVKFKIKELERLDESFGRFDIVFCSNVLQHHHDIIGNIEKIKNVTKEKAILCLGIIDEFNDRPMAQFLGGQWKTSSGIDVGNYWRPNIMCVKKICERVGFKKIDVVSKFIHEFKNDQKMTEGVFHCYVSDIS